MWPGKWLAEATLKGRRWKKTPKSDGSSCQCLLLENKSLWCLCLDYLKPIKTQALLKLKELLFCKTIKFRAENRVNRFRGGQGEHDVTCSLRRKGRHECEDKAKALVTDRRHQLQQWKDIWKRIPIRRRKLHVLLCLFLAPPHPPPLLLLLFFLSSITYCGTQNSMHHADIIALWVSSLWVRAALEWFIPYSLSVTNGQQSISFKSSQHYKRKLERGQESTILCCVTALCRWPPQTYKHH